MEVPPVCVDAGGVRRHVDLCLVFPYHVEPKLEPSEWGKPTEGWGLKNGK